MIEKRDNLIRAIKLWLEKNDLTTDTTFYTIEKWLEREEPYHNDSEFVITTEGELNFIINYGTIEQQIEFEDLVNSFGFWYEIGHSWNLGFYYDEENIPNQNNGLKTYSEKLRDSRWIEKREVVKQNAGNKCQDCGSKANLEVHHCYYQYGREPWEYSFDSLRCLCRKCHEERGKLELILRAKFADLNYRELNVFKNLVSDSLLSYDRKSFFDFLQSIGNNKTEMDKKYEEMKTSKR